MIHRSDGAEIIHIWSRCHLCAQRPIVGLRFECQDCPAGPNNDLCQKCFDVFCKGEVRHPIVDIGLNPTFHQFKAFTGKSSTLYKDWLSVQTPNCVEPTMPQRFVIRPEFHCGHESFIGSYGFIIKPNDNSSALLLTALHVLDQIVKQFCIDCSPHAVLYDAVALASIVTGATLYDPFAPRWMFAEICRSGPMVPLPFARIGDEEPYSDRDIAAFFLDDAPEITPCTLAEKSPNVGDPVWLVSNQTPGVSGRAIKAVVVESTERTLIYRFSASLGSMSNTSGAPIVNAEGAVVGLTVGGGHYSGFDFGHANNVTSIRRHLASIGNP